MPCIITEQYPKGLGHTTEEIKVAEGGEVFSKTLFSMLTDEGECRRVRSGSSGARRAQTDRSRLLARAVRARLDTLLSAGRRNFVIVGLEAHVCVQQTSLDLLAMGCGVQLCVDAVSSQTTTDRAAGLHRAERAGALLTSSESVLFELIRAKEHPSFKAISKLVTSSRPPADVGTLGWLGA